MASSEWASSEWASSSMQTEIFYTLGLNLCNSFCIKMAQVKSCIVVLLTEHVYLVHLKPRDN